MFSTCPSLKSLQALLRVKSGEMPLSKGTLVSRLLTPWPGRLEHPKMFRYLPSTSEWSFSFVACSICLGVVNSCCGELKYANFSEINSNYS